MNHKTKTAKRYTAGGKSLTMREWAKRLHCSDCTLRARIKYRMKKGMSFEDALLTPTSRPDDLARRNSARSPWRQSNKRLFGRYE